MRGILFFFSIGNRKGEYDILRNFPVSNNDDSPVQRPRNRKERQDSTNDPAESVVGNFRKHGFVTHSFSNCTANILLHVKHSPSRAFIPWFKLPFYSPTTSVRTSDRIPSRQTGPPNYFFVAKTISIRGGTDVVATPSQTSGNPRRQRDEHFRLLSAVSLEYRPSPLAEFHENRDSASMEASVSDSTGVWILSSSFSFF